MHSTHPADQLSHIHRQGALLYKGTCIAKKWHRAQGFVCVGVVTPHVKELHTHSQTQEGFDRSSSIALGQTVHADYGMALYNFIVDESIAVLDTCD